MTITRQQRDPQLKSRLHDFLRNGPDRCTLCRGRFVANGLVLAGFTADKEPAIVHAGCEGLRFDIWYGSMYGHLDRGNAPEPPWTASDRQWFAARPDRAFRGREPYPDEDLEIPHSTSVDHTLCVIVWQTFPGLRSRYACPVPTVALPLPDYDPILHAMVDMTRNIVATPTSAAGMLALFERYEARVAQESRGK
jgi:hypothetical protein